MNSLENSLSTLLHNLLLGALVTSLIGIAGGLWVARRAVRPLERVSLAAGAIAEGNLSTRLQVTRADREVLQLTESFNQMVSQLVDRLERDARFASDVSHELRSPLTTLATTATVLAATPRGTLARRPRESRPLDGRPLHLSILGGGPSRDGAQRRGSGPPRHGDCPGR